MPTPPAPYLVAQHLVLRPLDDAARSQPLRRLQMEEGTAPATAADGTKAGRLRSALKSLLREHEADGALPASARFLCHELVKRSVISKAKTGARRPDQDMSDALTQQVGEHGLPVIVKNDRRYRDGRPRAGHDSQERATSGTTARPARREPADARSLPRDRVGSAPARARVFETAPGATRTSPDGSAPRDRAGRREAPR
ncbi:MAG: hypothetical protein ACRDOK_09665 [Streptosporangiaceae bacterium]